jgi:hypothetical protein
MIYINTQIPIEELSKLQTQYEKERRLKIRDDWIDKHRDALYKYHNEWAKNNKDLIAIYREDNRERIREYHRRYIKERALTNSTYRLV